MKMQIIKIEDTRQGFEEGDRIVRIPGTGSIHECAICGADHEIHVHLETDQGVMIVGLGCAKKMQGVDRLIKVYEIEKTLASIVPPEALEINTRRSPGPWGRVDVVTSIYPVTDGSRGHNFSCGRRRALEIWAKKYAPADLRPAWKKYLSTNKRLKNRLAALQAVEA